MLTEAECRLAFYRFKVGEWTSHDTIIFGKLLEEYFNLVEDHSITTERIKKLREDLAKRNKFIEYFDGLYGQGLEVVNWHLNGALEALDNFIDSAEEYMERE